MPDSDKTNSKLHFIHQLSRRWHLVAAALLLVVLYCITFRERPLSLSYSGQTCDQRLTVLPGLFRQTSDTGYEVTTEGGWKVGDTQLIATSICVKPTRVPSEHSVEKVAFAPWGGWFARLVYAVEAGKHPAVDTSVLQEAIPVSRPLELTLAIPDDIFDYQMRVNGSIAPCQAAGQRISCDIPALKLRQKSTYSMSLERLFKGEAAGEAARATLTTLSPLGLKSTSIKQGTTVYNKPRSLSLVFDKPLERAEFAVERVDGKKTVALEAATAIADNTATVTFARELPRQAAIRLKATTLEATDGSTTLDPYTLSLKTSGGPRVTAVNVGASGVMVGSTIAVTFDQALAADQDISAFIQTGGGVRYQGRQGNQLLFSTTNASRCGALSIRLTGDIKSRHGVSGQSAWQYNGRASCYTVSTVGYSRHGRPINAYYFGGSGVTTLYVGAIHGSEPSSQYILEDWIAELDANPGRIPSGHRVVVVPSLNPDGVAMGSRNNAAGVNLDRNFPTDDWKADIHSADGFKKGGGGKKPLSEPESKAIASLVQQLRPRLMLSYHSQGGLVMGDPGALSERYAARYAAMVGFRDSTYGTSTETFGYPATGLFEGWAYQKAGVPNIVVELTGHYTREFPRHREAFWAMLR